MAAGQHHRPRRLSSLPAFLAAATVVLLTLATCQVAAAHTPGSGRWYWPVGVETFTMAGWLDPRGGSYHVAQDMQAGYGQPVYAVGAGTVWKAKADADWYGPGGSPGGVMIIIHTTATGERFRALYGHIQGLRYREGQRVAAGVVIGAVNGCRHLHFGIHLGSSYPDDNPYRGHVPMSWPDYGGWVDPVRYLRTHPRIIPYLAPSLTTERIATETTPLSVGAADGVAYWTEQTERGITTSALDLTTLERRLLVADEELPAFDNERYLVAKLAAPAIGFTVKDRQPTLAVTRPHLSPAWGVRVRLAGRLTNWGGRPFQGARVRLERLASGSWLRLGSTVSAGDGRMTLSWAPPRRTLLRLRFVPATAATPRYLGAASSPLTVAPHVRLTVPAAPAAVAAGAAFTVGGYLTPRHVAGRGIVDLELQRFDGSSWVAVLAVAATTRDAGERSRYGRNLSLAKRGSWRVRAVHSEDAAHAATRSGWRTFAVR